LVYWGFWILSICSLSRSWRPTEFVSQPLTGLGDRGVAETTLLGCGNEDNRCPPIWSLWTHICWGGVSSLTNSGRWRWDPSSMRRPYIYQWCSVISNRPDVWQGWGGCEVSFREVSWGRPMPGKFRFPGNPVDGVSRW